MSKSKVISLWTSGKWTSVSASEVEVFTAQPQNKPPWASDCAHCQSSIKNWYQAVKTIYHIESNVCLVRKSHLPCNALQNKPVPGSCLLRGAKQHLSSTGTRVAHKKVRLKLAGNENVVKWGNRDKHCRSHIRSSTASVSHSAQVKQAIPKCQQKAAVPVHKGALRDREAVFHRPSLCTHSLCSDVPTLRPVPHVELSQVGKEGNYEVVPFLQCISHKALHPGMRAILGTKLTTDMLRRCCQWAQPFQALPVSPSAFSSPKSTAQCLLGAELICSTGINRPTDKQGTLIPLHSPTFNWIN